jgi:hypothetical protein
MNGALPHSDDAERAVICSVLCNNPRFEEAAAIVGAADFFSIKNGIIWRAIGRLVAGESPVDLVTLRDELERTEEIEQAGGVAYLTDLLDNAARPSNVVEYARIVKEKAARRAVMQIIERAGNGATMAQLAQAMSRANKLIEAAGPAPETCSATRLDHVFPEVVEEAVRDLFRIAGVAMIYGPAGVFKTLILLSIATRMLASRCGDPNARPETLFGDPRLIIRRPWRRTLWISAEETAGTLRARWDRVLAGMSLKPDDVPGELLYRWAFEDGRVLTIDRVDAILAALPDPVDAVVLDSWTSLVPGKLDGAAVEWDRDNYATRRLLNALRAIAERRKVLIVIVHHSGHDKTHARGPSEFRNAVDTLIRFERRPERRVQLHVEKQRDGADDWSTTVAVQFEREAVHVRYEERAAKKLTAIQQAVRAYLAGAGPATVAAITAETGYPRTTVIRALEALQDASLAAPTGDFGPKSSPIWHLTHVTQCDASVDACGEEA